MCDPISLTMAAGAAVTAVGQIQSGAYTAGMARYQAQVAQQNKQLTHEAAADAITRGQIDQVRLGRDIAQRVGAQTARIGANNTDITFGSAARTIADTKLIGAEDQATMAENTRREVKGLQIDAWNEESQRRADMAEAHQAPIGAVFGAASTVLGAATQYSKFKGARA